MYSCSPALSQISLKNSFGKVVFQILAKIEMTRNKNQLFGRHFEMVQLFFFAELWFFIVHTYMVQISLQNSAGKVVFYAWVPRNPPGGKSPIGILNKVGPFQEILKIVTNLFIFDRSCQKTITLLVSYKR